MAYHAPEETWEETAITERIMRHTTAIVQTDSNHIVAIVGWMIVIAEIILTVDPDRPEMEHGS